MLTKFREIIHLVRVENFLKNEYFLSPYTRTYKKNVQRKTKQNKKKKRTKNLQRKGKNFNNINYVNKMYAF